MRLDEVTYMRAFGFRSFGELVTVGEVAQALGTGPPFVV